MRIIAGEYRHRLIRSPEGTNTRPITDRVRTSLFDRLTSMGYMTSHAALDIFSGTGTLGLEALSRGVEHVTFVEKDFSTRKLLTANLADFELTQRSTVLASHALTAGWLGMLPHKPIELIFCDPPYVMSQEEASRQSLANLLEQLALIASEDGLLILRTQEYTPAIPTTNWPEPKTLSYGSMLLHFYQKSPSAD